MGKKVRVGCASAFWGDTSLAAASLVQNGQLDFLVFDYLSEVTLSLLARNLNQPEGGFVPDFVAVLSPLLVDLKKQGIRVVSNGGGMNPAACARCLEQAAAEAGVSLKIAFISGDDIMPELARFQGNGLLQTPEGFPKHPLTANVYLGAPAIALALDQGADIVITGRCVDSAVTLGPLMHVFGWSTTDYDLLAAGSLAGHLIECGTQATGGNFTDWALVEGFENMGFPILICSADGSFEVTKPAGTGGMVSPHTLAEQLLYEIGNPQAYLLPDVICDFSQVRLVQKGPDLVLVSGARGWPPTGQYKVSVTGLDGFRLEVAFVLMGLFAREKGKSIAAGLLARARNYFTHKGWSDFSAVDLALVGTESAYGPRATANPRELLVRIAVRHPQKEALGFFAREIAQAATAMAPGLCSLAGGRPHPSPNVRHYSCFLPKSAISVDCCQGKSRQKVSIMTDDHPIPATAKREIVPPIPSDSFVPLYLVALARSGDKGNHANIGVIARSPGVLPYIRAALSNEAVASWFEHLGVERVESWELGGINGLNFLLYNILGGGGTSSLRVDPQGKALAQMLLEFPIPMPRNSETEPFFQQETPLWNQ